MSTIACDKQTSDAWMRLHIAISRNGITLPFSLGDTVGWSDFHHRSFVNVGRIIAIHTPYPSGTGGFYVEDGIFHLLGDTQIGNFKIEIKPKFLSSENHISTIYLGEHIRKLRSARVVIVEKIKKLN